MTTAIHTHNHLPQYIYKCYYRNLKQKPLELKILYFPLKTNLINNFKELVLNEYNEPAIARSNNKWRKRFVLVVFSNFYFFLFFDDYFTKANQV